MKSWMTEISKEILKRQDAHITDYMIEQKRREQVE